MSFYTYPSAADVEALLKSASYWPTDSVKQEFARLQTEIAAQAAADEWENLTGWSPFLAAPGDATARTFLEVDTRGLVDFQGGAVEIVSVTQGGNALVLGTGYREEPQNAASRKQAITGIEVGGHYGSLYYGNLSQNPIVVTAKWGRVSEVPGDVFQAIQQKAALIVLTQIENLQSIASISEDGFSKAFDTVGILTQKDMATLWGKDFEKLAGRWQRVVR